MTGEVKHINAAKLFIDGNPVYEYTIKVLPPVSDNKRVPIRANAVIFENKGDRDVTVDGWLIRPGAVWSIGASSSMLHVLVQDFRIQFDTSRGSTSLLEIAEVRVANIPELDRYMEQKRGW